MDRQNGRVIYLNTQEKQLIRAALGGSDKMQNLDFGPTHKTGSAKHRINDFCFLKFFISIFDPSQAQKTIFSRFQLCGISLDMF